jgi:hypothetical protein
MPWQPTTILRFEGAVASSSGVLRVVTDQGKGYLKALGNPAGPQVLAREWVGTNLAKRFGLSTFDFAIVQVTDADELPFAKGGLAQPGPAFIARAEEGAPWGGSEAELKKLVNPHDLARLVVFDTWIRNRDRHPPTGSAWRPALRNVFLSVESAPEGQLRLKAMDHTHAFTWAGSLTAKLADIGEVQDERVYGRFERFEPWVDRDRVKRILEDLRVVEREEIVQIVQGVPAAWEVSPAARDAWVSLVFRRAGWLADHLPHLLWAQQEMNF